MVTILQMRCTEALGRARGTVAREPGVVQRVQEARAPSMAAGWAGPTGLYAHRPWPEPLGTEEGGPGPSCFGRPFSGRWSRVGFLTTSVEVAPNATH